MGDSWRADARGALGLGLRAAWISAGRSTPDDGHDAERLRVFTTIDAFFDRGVGDWERTRGVDSRSDGDDADAAGAARGATMDLFRDEWCVYCTVLLKLSSRIVP